MELFKLLQKKSKFFFVHLVLLAIVNSIWAGALLLFINNKITGEKIPYVDEYDWQTYIVLIVTSFIVAKSFQAYMIRLTYNLGNELNLSIFNKLRFSGYNEFLILGEEKVRTAMTDVNTLQSFPQTFIEAFNAIIMVVIGIVYLFMINIWAALMILSTLILLAVIYYVRNISIEKDLNKVRDLANVYQDNVNDFLRGYKEIKMSSKRSDVIFKKFITENRTAVKNLTIKALTKHLVNELMANYAWYFMIGIILFVLPIAITITQEANVVFMVTLLYLLGPVSIVVGSIHEFTKIKIATDRLEKFNKVINSSDSVLLGHGDMTDFNSEFESIRFEDVTFEYFDKQKKEVFKLQPINITISKGESIFITGGNGSGKSTFIYLLSGLYKPTSGNIYLNDRLINNENYGYYRDQITCVFTENYLFAENYNEFDFSDKNDELNKLVKKMQIEHVFEFDSNNKKLKITLSKGQQKRVALIYSMLEDKDIIILDEWAAEQDPKFRKYFYEHLVPDLKKRGKTLIAITHDDIYFNCAKRLIEFNYGSIIKDVVKETENVF